MKQGVVVTVFFRGRLLFPHNFHSSQVINNQLQTWVKKKSWFFTPVIKVSGLWFFTVKCHIMFNILKKWRLIQFLLVVSSFDIFIFCHSCHCSFPESGENYTVLSYRSIVKIHVWYLLKTKTICYWLVYCKEGVFNLLHMVMASKLCIHIHL